jgi:hypothetical protein
MQATHDEIILRKNLPRVGQTVRNKKDGKLWRVMEKREVWQPTGDDPKDGHPRLVPAIHLTYWLIQQGVMPGIGQMIGQAYTLLDNTFEFNWEVLEVK